MSMLYIQLPTPSHFRNTSTLLHPDTLTRPLCAAAASLALHLLHREASPIRRGLCVIALRVPLLAAETVLLVLLCALVGVAPTALAVCRCGLVVEGDVEQIFFLGVADVCALSFYQFVST